MNSQEFVIWLKGFTQGVHDFNITPKQWDIMKEKLAEVSDDKFVEPPGMFQVHPPPHPGAPLDPYNPWKVTCQGPETPCGTTITTTPGTTGYVTVANPYIASFDGSRNTSTTYVNPQSGSWHYTTTTGIKDFSPSEKLDVGGQITDKTLLHD